MAALAEVGALNALEAQHRRDALWQSGRAARAVGPLLAELRESSLQNIDNVISIKARRLEALTPSAAAPSHDFH